MSDIKYLHMDITGWSKEAKDFLKKNIECASTYQMSFDMCSEEEIDHCVIVRGNQSRINRVFDIIKKRYKKHPGHITIEKAEGLIDPFKENSKTYKQFLDKWVYNPKFKELSDSLNAIAREG